MGKIYMLGFIYDDFSEGGFGIEFVSEDKEKCLKLMREQSGHYEVREYQMDTEIDYENYKRIACIRNGRVFL